LHKLPNVALNKCEIVRRVACRLRIFAAVAEPNAMNHDASLRPYRTVQAGHEHERT
jgi:hypothetical protein